MPAAMEMPPQLLALIRSARSAGMQIDENDPEQVMRFLQMLQARAEDEEDSPPPRRTETIPEAVLSTFDIRGVAEHIRQGKAKNIIVMIGAGLSTAAGIPDFRTPGTGLYDNLQKYNLPRPEAIFTLDYFRERPGAFYELAKEMWPGNFMPTKAHFFIRLLEEKGLLLRCFTQNIDSLEELAGVTPDKIMAAHGNFSTAHGLDTGEEVPMEEVKAAVMRGEEGWREMTARRGTLVKPDIVFFGEGLPERFGRLVDQDFPKCDLLIVMGTSLVVAPFCTCITFVERHCPRLLVNREPAGLERARGRPMQGRMHEGFRIGEEFEGANWRDAFFQGDCDAGVEALCSELGWSEDLERVYADGIRSLQAAESKEEPQSPGAAAVQQAVAAPPSTLLGRFMARISQLCAPRRRA